MADLLRSLSDMQVAPDGWAPSDVDIVGPEVVRLGGRIPVRFVTKDPDPDWVARRRNARIEKDKARAARLLRVGLGEFDALYSAAEARLRDSLLAFGGWDAISPSLDRDLPRIIERGFLIPGAGAGFRKGKPCSCHQNSIRAWEVDRANVAVMTGLALSEDGFWREHSWHARKGPRKIRIIETTVSRVAYFGYVRRPEESAEMLADDGADQVALLKAIGSELARVLGPRV